MSNPGDRSRNKEVPKNPSLRSFPVAGDDSRSSIESRRAFSQDDKKTWSGKSTPSPGSPTTLKSIEAGHVNVKQAESQFEELNIELKRSLRRSQSIERAAPHDLEKGSILVDQESQSSFNLESILRGDRAAADEAGIKLKQIGVLWKDLTVRGIGGTKNYVKTFPHVFLSFLNIVRPLRGIFGAAQKKNEVDILKSFRGVIKPGEMVLVLGRPGSGCTTFLKVISNQRFGYTGVLGDVFYGPFDHQMFSKRYRGEAVYNAEDESQTMHATLSVGQTLAFALDTKVPGKRPAGLSRRDFKERVIETLLKMFNIEVSQPKQLTPEYLFELRLTACSIPRTPWSVVHLCKESLVGSGRGFQSRK
jgi:ATP-binding cassette, subfamily G (WHITE), member 2, SNQ2